MCKHWVMISCKQSCQSPPALILKNSYYFIESQKYTEIKTIHNIFAISSSFYFQFIFVFSIILMDIDDAKFCNNAAEKCISRTEYRICLFEKG